MSNISFDKLLFKTAFCCIAADGHIDKREIIQLKSMCENSNYFPGLNFEVEINELVYNLNEIGKGFFREYFDQLKNLKLSEEEEIAIIDFALKTFRADEQIEYAEIKFFKVIRHNLKVSDDRILSIFPDIEQFLEEDIVTESYLEKITNQYLEMAHITKFDLISRIDELPKSE